MPAKAKTYIGAMLLLGAACTVYADWRLLNLTEFLCFLLLAVFASGMKVRLPGILGTLSVNYLFILVGILDMTGGEALAIGCASALVQCLWHAKKHVRPVQAAFSTMNVAISVAASYAFYHWPLVQQLNHGTPLALMASSLIYFGVNTAGVAIVIALSEGKQLVGTWKDCYFWSFPFYLVAASLVWVVRGVDPRAQWLNALVLVPIIYVIYRSYHIYLDNLEAGKKHIELMEILQQRTTEALDAAREATVVKSRFVASVSHELRTPLNGIIGFTELLYDGVLGPINEAQKESLGDVLNCSNHLRELIGQVLDLAKIEAGKVTFEYESVSLARLVREVIDTLRALAISKQIEIRFQPNADVDSVVADVGRLKQILYNYLSNALKFTGTNGRVTVSVSPEGSMSYRIVVEDSGCGIAPSEITRLFSEFSQVGDSGKAKMGTGLGLAICKHLAEGQGGRVGVESEVGRGSRFYVVLPRNPQAGGISVDAPASADPVAPTQEHCLAGHPKP